MQSIKSYTDLEQSKKLAEILPLESADMYYFRQIDNDYFPPDVESICPIPLFKDGKEDFNYDIRCWSLAALISVLPTLDDRNAILCKDIRYDKWHVCYHSTATLSIIDTERYDNPVDACYEMILKLHELNLLLLWITRRMYVPMM